MSLVAYGSSDESDEEDFPIETNVVIKNKQVISSARVDHVEGKLDSNENKNADSKTNGSSINDKVENVSELVVESDALSGDKTDISDEDETEVRKYKYSDLSESETIENKSLSSLPAPKTKLHDIDFDWSLLSKGNKITAQPVKISIPSLAELETEESAEPVKKKLKPSKKGSGLFALLPNPKNAFINQTKTTLKPQQINNKQPLNKPVFKDVKRNSNSNRTSRLPSILPTVNYDDSPDEDDGNDDSKKVDFFSLSSPVTVPAAEIQIPELESLVIPNKKEEKVQLQKTNLMKNDWSNRPSISQSGVEKDAFGNNTSASVTSDYTTPLATSSESFIPFNQEDIQLDETALQQLCGRRERQKNAEFQVIDVSGDAILPDAREWMTKQLTEEQNTNIQSHKKKDGPTTQQRRKHQITYLAFQAKEHELELKNQWANNRMSRKQTQAKYGF